MAWLAGCGICGREFPEAEVRFRVNHVGGQAAADRTARAALRAIAHAMGWYLPSDYDLNDETRTRCPDCARQCRASEPTTLYLVKSERRRALKIGVARRTSSRLRVHGRRGWRVVELNGEQCWWLLRRVDALAVEQAVIARWRSAGVPMAPACAIAAENGYTETASLDAASVPDTVGWIEELARGHLLELDTSGTGEGGH
ncbi:hypothetical protein [Nocardia cyriacigeorgica]|uniref:hypothetical protein n=1 Tax=Nocardia cyriacigeorgica TaxID=135487 RepID=UPI0011D1DF93|nr:hypothetical protein [Nocardia cyriacigeorgica]